MNAECAFARNHPFTLLLWFCTVLCVTVLTMNPIIAALSLLFSTLHIVMISTQITLLTVARTAAFMVIITLLNPLFSHHGATTLFFLGGLPITLEALIFGAFMSVVVTSSVLWCVSLTRCMTSDKIIFLFGKPFPRLAVLISLTLRFIPLFIEKYKSLCASQKAAGLFDGSVRAHLRVFSALVSMIMEDSIDTSDSMRARGAELSGRTTYSAFRFRRNDAIITIFTIISAAFFIISAVDFSFYPTIGKLPTNARSVITYILFGILAAVPSLTEMILWKRSGSIK